MVRWSLTGRVKDVVIVIVTNYHCYAPSSVFYFERLFRKRDFAFVAVLILRRVL